MWSVWRDLFIYIENDKENLKQAKRRQVGVIFLDKREWD